MWEGFEVVTPECWASLVKHVREKVEDHCWEVNGHYSVCEFTFHICRRPNDPNEESSSESDTASHSDSDNDGPMADDDDDFF